MKSVVILSTGGTIEKTYDELEGVLTNQVSVLEVMLAGLNLRGVHVERHPLMNLDSLEMTPAHHLQIAKAALAGAEKYDGVVVVHGTDTLEVTGEAICELGPPVAPVVLTGAMRPYELRTTDATQNLTEALLAVQLVQPGVYVAMHNQVHQFPGVVKDRRRMTFVPREDLL